MAFELHPNLAIKTLVTELPLCKVLLEDERNYPWLILVAKRERKRSLFDLTFQDQVVLIQELNLAQKALWNLFKADQFNVAAIGNKTPQLHVHLIVRFAHDPAWPGTVWDHPRVPYRVDEKERYVKSLKEQFALLSEE